MEVAKKEELVALIDYLVKHNEHHNEELKDLANSLKDFNVEAYTKVLEAIQSYKEGNEKLLLALKEMQK